MECELPRVNSNQEEMKGYFQESMIPVYPKEETILGQKVYRSLAEIDTPVDMVVVFRKPSALDAIADAVIARGDIKVYWTQLHLVNNNAADKVKSAGISVVQNYCAMVEHKAIFNS